MQEYLESQMLPMRLVQEQLNFEKRFSLTSQLDEYSQKLQKNIAMNELLGNSGVSKIVQDFIGGSSVAATAQRMFEDLLPKYPLNSLGQYGEGVSRAAAQAFENEALLQATSVKQLFDISKQYDQYLNPISKHQEMLAQLGLQSYGGALGSEFSRHFEEINPTFKALEHARKYLDGMWPTFRDYDFSQLQVDEDDGEDAKQIAKSLNHSTAQETSFEEAVKSIVRAIQAQEKPAVQLILWLYFRKLVELILAGAIGAAMSHYTPMVLGESPQAAKKNVQENARFAVGSLELLDEYRFVSTTVLIVRQNPGALSPEIGRLSFSKPVRLLKRDKAFALVLWSDKDSGAEIQGWVFARYLEKFN